jgi:RNA polymerase sigma-54 factor
MSQTLAMEILRLPILALLERVQQELQENPVLEVAEGFDTQFAAEQADDSLPEESAPAEGCPENEPVILKFGQQNMGSEEPKPQSDIENIPSRLPDIAVGLCAKDGHEMRLFDYWTPHIFVSRKYLELFRDDNADPKVKEYLKRKIQAGERLLDAIAERGTLLKMVTRSIMEQQWSFLTAGPKRIQTLDLEALADRAGLSVRMVELVIDEKWVKTPHGTFPLTRFVASLSVRG